jgi:starvation-inducible outer membrane lipoprotein
MKKVIISALTLTLTGCTSILDELEKPLKPKVDETNYWKIPCIWDGATLKKPYYGDQKPDSN